MGFLAIVGPFVNPQQLHHTELIQRAFCLVNSSTGIIEHFERLEKDQKVHLEAPFRYEPIEWVYLEQGQFILPGFIDMHTHAPQYRNLGLGLDRPLLQWLEKTTFPEEKWYGRGQHENGMDYSQRIAKVYGTMVRHYLRAGTTTCCYFSSIHPAATRILVKEIARNGQRGLVGKTCMDCNSPSDYVETTNEAIDGTTDLINYIERINKQLNFDKQILPVVTPRFAITCSEALMRSLADLANRHNLHIQTHMSENLEETKVVKELFPTHANYASVYDAMGLLTPKTILAHCIHLDDTELQLLAQRNVAIAHCPNSNFCLSSGMMNVRAALKAGIRLGLGTDVSGGHSVCMLDTIRQAIITSKAQSFQNPTITPLSSLEALFLATLGGAIALGLERKIGNFAVGKEFDALLVDSKACRSLRHPEEDLEATLQRFIFTGDQTWISEVYVSGFPTFKEKCAFDWVSE